MSDLKTSDTVDDNNRLWVASIKQAVGSRFDWPDESKLDGFMPAVAEFLDRMDTEAVQREREACAAVARKLKLTYTSPFTIDACEDIAGQIELRSNP